MKLNSRHELFKSIEQMQFKQRQKKCEMLSELHFVTFSFLLKHPPSKG